MPAPPSVPVAAEPQPHTVSPNSPLLVAWWRPLLHDPTPWKLPVDRSTRVISYWPAVPTEVQPPTVPRQSRVTSWKPEVTFVRTSTRLVSGYVGSVKNTYDVRYSCGGMTFTNSGSPRASDSDGSTVSAPDMCAERKKGCW